MKKTYGIVYEGPALRAVAMPLGGIGTGSVAIAGDGGLRQWQLANTVNHLGHVPLSFFGVWSSHRYERTARVLMSDALYDDADFMPSPNVNDHVVPPGSRALLAQLPGVAKIRFTGAYPIATLNYFDEALPLEVTLEAFTPFVPLNAEASGIPAAVFTFTVRNPDEEQPAAASLLMAQQNAVGWDGQSRIEGMRNPGYGGGSNALASLRGVTAIHMTNPTLPQTHPLNGSMAMALLHPEHDASLEVTAVPAWSDTGRLWKDFSHDGQLIAAPPGEGRPSPPGETRSGAVACRFALGPGESRTVTFVLAWHFPNRYVTWDQGIEDKKSLFWLGNAYNRRFGSALAVLEHIRDEGRRLGELTRAFCDAFYGSTLPAPLLEAAGSQISTLRTPTCLWLENGEFHGFEGCCGASTPHCTGDQGCCPMDCTHVWNYEMTLAALFPALERTMRETNLKVQMQPSGAIPHRAVLPTYLPRTNRLIGPDKPALDGMLGEVLKVYREVQRGAGRGWLWPAVKQMMAHIMEKYDVNGDGVIRGEQPNTYDISIYGPNTFIGSLYLAALRAAEALAKHQGENELAAQYRERFEAGRENLNKATWNDTYWGQDVNLSVHREYQWGTGCHADQLLGQWWAHMLGLGYVLPQERVRQALQAIFTHNWKDNLTGDEQSPRIFADQGDAGLLNCTWPKGGKPEVPTLYSDEVWSGIEYEVAALLLMEGMAEEALAMVEGVRARYDGRRRNPWNEIECGDHYVRSMSSWALYKAACGVHYDAVSAALTVAPRLAADDLQCFFTAGEAWGRLAYARDATRVNAELHIHAGRLALETLRMDWPADKKMAGAILRVNGAVVSATWGCSAGRVKLEPAQPLALAAGDVLDIRLGG